MNRSLVLGSALAVLTLGASSAACGGSPADTSDALTQAATGSDGGADADGGYVRTWPNQCSTTLTRYIVHVTAPKSCANIKITGTTGAPIGEWTAKPVFPGMQSAFCAFEWAPVGGTEPVFAALEQVAFWNKGANPQPAISQDCSNETCGLVSTLGCAQVAPKCSGTCTTIPVGGVICDSCGTVYKSSLWVSLPFDGDLVTNWAIQISDDQRITFEAPLGQHRFSIPLPPELQLSDGSLFSLYPIQ